MSRAAACWTARCPPRRSSSNRERRGAVVPPHPAPVVRASRQARNGEAGPVPARGGQDRGGLAFSTRGLPGSCTASSGVEQVGRRCPGPTSSRGPEALPARFPGKERGTRVPAAAWTSWVPGVTPGVAPEQLAEPGEDHPVGPARRPCASARKFPRSRCEQGSVGAAGGSGATCNCGLRQPRPPVGEGSQTPGRFSRYRR